jgi:hypothetical protein
MSVTFDVFSTDVSRANQSEDLIINVTVELIDYIKNLRVSCFSELPFLTHNN